MKFNRSLQVRLVKSPKNPLTGEKLEEETVAAVADIVRETTETIATHIVIGIGVYVAVDTLRQVIIKATPEG